MLGYHYDDSRDTQIRNPIIQKHKKMLSRIANAGVFALLYNTPNNFFLLECCDGYYAFDLNREDCLELSEMFKELAEAIQ